MKKQATDLHKTDTDPPVGGPFYFFVCVKSVKVCG